MGKNKEKEIFLSKTSSAFIVLTQDRDCHIVTQELDITPDKYHQKGEKTNSKFSSNPVIRLSGLWEISKVSIAEGASLAEHIKHFQEILEDKFDVIAKLKQHYSFECVFYVLIETEDAGVGFDLDEAELVFINKISNRFTFSVVAVKSL